MSDDAKLLKFIVENKIETRWDDEECLIWIPHYLLSEFVELFSWHFETEKQVVGMIQQEDVCINLAELFDDLALEELIEKD
ncbi:hypothetical protein [Enterococcus sp. AZ103]|uniref:hypothetical protein n=1 Tax=Enterococcus sp. AZ103 TaxID=2774628 RepID=UPI003F25E964